MDLKNMISKQQKYIDDHDINSDNKDFDLLFDGNELEIDDNDVENEDVEFEEQFLNDIKNSNEMDESEESMPLKSEGNINGTPKAGQAARRKRSQNKISEKVRN